MLKSIFLILSSSNGEFCGATSNPFSLEVMSIRFSGISVVMTGMPAAIASRIAFDWPSKRVGRTKR